MVGGVRGFRGGVKVGDWEAQQRIVRQGGWLITLVGTGGLPPTSLASSTATSGSERLRITRPSSSRHASPSKGRRARLSLRVPSGAGVCGCGWLPQDQLDRHHRPHLAPPSHALPFASTPYTITPRTHALTWSMRSLGAVLSRCVAAQPAFSAGLPLQHVPGRYLGKAVQRDRSCA